MMQKELTPDDDFLVMASDGLWDVLKNKVIVVFMVLERGISLPNCSFCQEIVYGALLCCVSLLVSVAFDMIIQWILRPTNIELFLLYDFNCIFSHRMWLKCAICSCWEVSSN